MLEVMENACGGGYGNIDLSSMDMHKAGKNAECYSMLGKGYSYFELSSVGCPRTSEVPLN